MTKKKIILTIDNALNYSLTLKNVFVFNGHSSGVATGFVIPANDQWTCTIQQNPREPVIKAKYIFKINGLIAPLTFGVKAEYIHWKDKQGMIEFYNSNDRIVEFGHGNIGEKIGAGMTGYTDEPILYLTAHIVASTEKRERYHGI